MKVGYIRVSTREQNTVRQDGLMKQLGVEKVYTDRLSGKNTDRPELRKMMDFVREGDSVIVESISRFARNTKDLLELIATLEAKGVQFISKKESVDTTSSTGKFMLAVFGAIAELEREYILDRQAEGIAIAKAEGRMNGRPRKTVDNFEKVYNDVKNKKLSATKAAKQIGISRSTWYRRLKELSAPVRFCNFSPDWECQKKAGKGMQPLNNYTCRFRPSSLKWTDKSGLDRLQADE